jgi:hypothetical protein
MNSQVLPAISQAGQIFHDLVKSNVLISTCFCDDNGVVEVKSIFTFL